MSDTAINKMNDKQLRAEVQALRDELAVFKRKYEDMIYNLDSDNFGRSFKVEQNNMKAQVKVTAEAIETVMFETTVLGDKLESNIKQTADLMESSVSIEDVETELKKYSIISQTADAIKAVVSKEYLEENIDLSDYQTVSGLGEILKSYSTVEQLPDQIRSTVNATYLEENIDLSDYQTVSGLGEILKDYPDNSSLTLTLDAYSTKTQTTTEITDAVKAERLYVTNLLNTNYYTREETESKITTSASGIEAEIAKVNKAVGDLEGIVEGAEDEISSLRTTVEANAEGLTTIVSKNISAYFESTYAPTKANTSDVQKAILCLYNKEYYYYDDNADEWKKYPSDGIKTMFKQTDEKFELVGDVLISGVDNDLYLGNLDTILTPKRIYFHSAANISSFHDTDLGHTGIRINASGFDVTAKPADIRIIAPDGLSFEKGKTTLADYVESVAPIAVFG